MSSVDDLKALSGIIDAALVAGDAVTFDTILAADFIFRQADGTLDDRVAFLAGLGPTPPRSADIQAVALAGALFATVTVTVVIGSPPGPLIVTQELRTFFRDANGWRLASWLVQPSAVSPPPSGGASPKAAAPSADDFNGSYIKQSAPVTIGLRSTYTGAAVVSAVPRALVAALLPVGVELASPKDPDQLYHPLIHMIGDQNQPSTFFKANGVDQLNQVGTGYREMLMLVPFTVRKGDDHWHNFALRMFLDNEVAVLGGNQIYGYAKVLSQIDRATVADTLTYRIASPDLATVWYEETVIAAQVPDKASAPAGWPAFAELLSMPMLGAQPADAVDPDNLVCSYWQFDFSGATIAPAVSTSRIVTPFRAGMAGWTDLPGVAAAFLIEDAVWRLALPPAPCEDY